MTGNLGTHIIYMMLSEIMQILAFCKKIFVISILTFNDQIINIIVENIICTIL